MSKRGGTRDSIIDSESRFPDLTGIASIVGGLLQLEQKSNSDEPVTVDSVAIDSRMCEPGTLFVALPGEQSDGEVYVDDAYTRGAAAAIVRNIDSPSGTRWPLPTIVVDDALKALHTLAAWYVDARLSSVTRVGITGSNGKTTTKEIVVALLSHLGVTFGSRGNFNSETGLPLSVFSTPPDVQYAVYEMAMSAPGEMEDLARIVRPDIAVITNIGTAHIGRVGSKHQIAKEKKAIASQFSGSQTLLLPEHDDFARFLAEDVQGTVEWFGASAQEVEIVSGIGGQTELAFADGGVVTLPMSGAHNGMNALSALRLAEFLGLARDRWPARIDLPQLPGGRAQRIEREGGGLIIQDAYNANPDSMRAGISMADEIRRQEYPEHRLILVLGDMYELGDQSGIAHQEIMEMALHAKPEVLVLVGEQFGEAFRAGSESIYEGTKVFHGPDAVALKETVGANIRNDDVVFLKGSRAIALEILVDAIRETEVTRV